MRLGYYGSLIDAASIGAIGFDYLEVNAQSLLRGEQPSSVWEAGAPDPDKLALPVEVASGLLPDDQKVIGPRRDRVQLQNYVQRVAKRAQRLGVRCLVFDSAPSRQRPADTDIESAWDQLEQFFCMAGEICAHHDVTIAVAPQGAQPCDAISNVDQARTLCDRVSHPCVGVSIDSQRCFDEQEFDEAVLKLGDRLRHVHVRAPADLTVRQTQASHRPDPARGRSCDDTVVSTADLDYFVCVLRKIGYHGPLTVRSQQSLVGNEAAAVWVDCLRQHWRQAGRFEG